MWGTMANIDGKSSGPFSVRAGPLFGDVLNWAFNILTAIGTAYAIINQPNLARDVATLSSRLDGHEKQNQQELQEHIREDDERDKTINAIDAQKNLNTTAIGELRTAQTSLAEQHNRDFDKAENELKDMRSSMTELAKLVDPEPGGQAANVREVRGELTEMGRRIDQLEQQRVELELEVEKRFAAEEEEITIVKRLSELNNRGSNNPDNDAAAKQKGPH